MNRADPRMEVGARKADGGHQQARVRSTSRAWIDGSFISEKIDPEDIDLTFVIHGDVYDSLSPALQAEIDSFENGQRMRPDLHVFPIVTRPMGHQNHAVTEAMVRNMAEWWCVARGGWIKGMPVIRLGETNVGLRILP